MRPTDGAGPLRRPGDEALLLAGRLQPVALVLVGVAVGAAHGDVVLVTLRSRHTESETRWDQSPPLLGEVKGQPAPHMASRGRQNKRNGMISTGWSQYHNKTGLDRAGGVEGGVLRSNRTPTDP